MMIRATALVLVAALALAAAACTGPAASAPTPVPGRPAPLLPASGSAAISRGDTKDTTSSLASTSADRLIVRTIRISMLVEDVSRTLESISSLVKGLDGFVVSSQVSGEEEAQRGFISFRVPADQTDLALARLRGMAVRVPSEETSSQDVTEEYVDLQARLKNLERTEEQYLRLLERAQSVEDTLKVQQQLSSVQGQIEQLKGRMQYLERTSATSLINVELRPASSTKRLVEPGWSPLETAKEAIRALAGFGQGLVDLAIRLGVFAPVWVPLGAAGWFLLRKVWRMR